MKPADAVTCNMHSLCFAVRAQLARKLWERYCREINRKYTLKVVAVYLIFHFSALWSILKTKHAASQINWTEHFFQAEYSGTPVTRSQNGHEQQFELAGNSS